MFAFHIPHLDNALLVAINIFISIVSFVVNVRAAKCGAIESRPRYIIVACLSIYMGILFALSFTNDVSDETAAFFIAACFSIQWIVMSIWPAISDTKVFHEVKAKTQEVLNSEKDICR